MEKAKPILRDAVTKDMKSIIYLIERLIEHEMKISEVPIIEDLQKRKKIVMKTVAQALVDPDKKIWVVDKSGRLLGVFIVEKQFLSTIEARNPVCVFTHAYSQKTVFPFHKIHNIIKKWATEKGCKSIVLTQLFKNVRAKELTESLGYNKTAVIYEMEV